MKDFGRYSLLSVRVLSREICRVAFWILCSFPSKFMINENSKKGQKKRFYYFRQLLTIIELERFLPIVQVGRSPTVNDVPSMQVIVLSPA